MGPLFTSLEMGRADFEAAVVDTLGPRDWVVTLIADTKDGRLPVGCVSAMNPLGTRLVTIADVLWFPWASSRNCLESMVHFINETRDDYTIMEYADEREAHTKGFFETLCKYAVMRRVGTVHDLYGSGNSAALYQSRRRKN